jgi:hypothetical protein
MSNPARLRRINADRAHDPMGFLIVIAFGPGRWPRVPPWRPRPPVLPPPGGDLPPPLPDADVTVPADLPVRMLTRELEHA